MESRLSNVLRISLAFGLAIALSLLSVRLQRIGPELAAYGNLCGPSHFDPCLEPVLNGGFPFAYLFDAPGISIEHQLSFGEDDLRPISLMLDIIVYFIATLLVGWGGSRCWSALKYRDDA